MIIKFNDFIKNSDSQLNTKAFIFYGENIGKIDNCTESLILSKKKKYENIEVIRKFTDELNHNELIPLVRQNSNPGLFGDQTIFILNIFNEKISKDIIFCIENHNFENLALIIRAEQLEARSTLRKYFEKKENLTIVPCYEETKFEKLSLIKDFCEREKIYFSEETKKELADSLSNQRIEILNDLNKIFFLTQHSNENFKPEELVSSPAHLDDLKFMNSIISGKINGFEDQLDQLCFFNNEQIKFISMMLEHFFRLLKVKLLINDGRTVQYSVENLRPKIFFKYKPFFETHLLIWSDQDLIKIIKKLLACRQSFISGEIIAKSQFLSCIMFIVRKANST